MSEHKTEHITSFREHFSIWLALIVLTIMTVTVSVYGADLHSLAVLTAMIIATTKVVVVGYYFMHLKYDHKIYRILVGVVAILFIVFMTLTIFDYLFR
jgi:cytochrome c oxidase subunit IV